MTTFFIRNNFLRRLATTVFCVAALGWSVSAQATALTYNSSTGFATGIDDLAVGDKVYDVSFVYGSYADVFSASAPTFLNDESGASLAGTAILNFMKAQAVMPRLSNSSWDVLVPFLLENGGTTYKSKSYGYFAGLSGWIQFGDTGSTGVTDNYADRIWPLAVFTEEPASSVPEPGTLALAGLGLAAVLMSRRTRA